jgi:hypothetical protein
MEWTHGKSVESCFTHRDSRVRMLGWGIRRILCRPKSDCGLWILGVVLVHRYSIRRSFAAFFYLVLVHRDSFCAW